MCTPLPHPQKEQRSSYYSLRGQSGGIWRSHIAKGTFTHKLLLCLCSFLFVAECDKNEEREKTDGGGADKECTRTLTVLALGDSEPLDR